MISVIVPVYNVEQYLKRCVDSILVQSYTDFEVLLIDDGSTDSSGQMCDEIESTDPRIRVFHKKNGGLSDARNYGLERMKGDYVTFIDSDDFIGPEYLSILMQLIHEYNTDVAFIRAVETSVTELIKSEDKRRFFTNKEAFEFIVVGRGAGVSAWGKLYRKEIFNDLKYPVGKVYEDLQTTPYIFFKDVTAAYSTSIQYYYFQRPGSITYTNNENSMKIWLKGIEDLYECTEQNYPDLKEAVICRYINSAFHTFINRSFSDVRFSTQARKIYQQHKDWWKSGLKNQYLPTSVKMKIRLFIIHPNLYRFVYKMFK